jgi:hypothetical protein
MFRRLFSVSKMLCFKSKTGQWLISRTVIVIIRCIYITIWIVLKDPLNMLHFVVVVVVFWKELITLDSVWFVVHNIIVWHGCMFNVDMQILHIHFVGMLMVKFHIQISSGSLAISIKLKDKNPDFMQSPCSFTNKKQKTNSVALSPRANYTDWSTATCRRNLVSTFCGWRGVAWSARRIPYSR